MRVTTLRSSLAVVLFGTLTSIAAADPVVQNASFESPVNTSGTPYGPIDNWTQSPYPSGLGGFDYLSGPSTTGGFPWDNGTVPGEGTTGQVGFIQVYGGVSQLSLTQNVSGFTPGQSYQLTYDENSRASTAVPQVQVLVGGQVVVAQHSDTPVEAGGNHSVPFRVETSIPFTATSSSEVVELRVNQTNAGEDATATFDNVSITAVPEPASVGVLGVALATLVLRRRTRAS